MTEQETAPKARELFLASMAATGLVYGIGILVIAVLVIITSAAKGLEQALLDGVVFIGFFATMGVALAAIAGVFLVAPLGTALSKLILRVTPARWWQGPLTGALVALTVVALTLMALAASGEPLDMGTYAVAAIPVLLAPFAGAFVQYRILNWARPERFA